MILAVDVHYKNNQAKAVGVLFNKEDDNPKRIITEYLKDIEDYTPGEFYKRELPCILKLTDQINLDDVELIIVDGHVYISNDKKLGLGGHLWLALHNKIPVIGVAKNKFHNTELVSFPVFRGKSKKPLYVSSTGLEVQKAIDLVESLCGEYRFPTVLSILDIHTKSKEV